MRIAATFTTTPSWGAAGNTNCVGTTTSRPTPGSHGSTPGFARQHLLVTHVEAPCDVGQRVLLADDGLLHVAHDIAAGHRLRSGAWRWAWATAARAAAAPDHGRRRDGRGPKQRTAAERPTRRCKRLTSRILHAPYLQQSRAVRQLIASTAPAGSRLGRKVARRASCRWHRLRQSNRP